MKKKISVILTCLFLVVFALGCAPKSEKVNSMNETFFNPLRVETGLGDPWMYFHDGYYYYMNSEGTQITVTKSKWMTQIVAKPEDETVTKVIARQKAMNLVEIWAPEIFFFEGYWYVYFTATTDDFATTLEKDTARRTYAIKSKTADAMGEWEQAVEILLPCDFRSIDATFMQYSGKQYIVWSGWPKAQNNGWWQDLYITELETGNPLKAKSLDPAARIRISTPTYGWETNGAPQNEGPAVVIAPDGTPVVLYSASYSGGDQYCIGYVTLDGDPMKEDDWNKGKLPLMATDVEYAEVIAPGHCSVTKSPDGTEDWIVYHAAKKSGSGWDRMTRLQKLEWKDGHIPVVEKIARFSDPIKLPSGEKVNRTLYEAESAMLSEGCILIDSKGENTDGSKYNYASGGTAVQLSKETDKITFEVPVKENGEYLLSFRFSNTSVGVTSISVKVNGAEMQLYAPLTEYNDSFIQNSFYTGLYVRESVVNTVEITCDKNIFIDSLVVDALSRK